MPRGGALTLQPVYTTARVRPSRLRLRVVVGKQAGQAQANSLANEESEQVTETDGTLVMLVVLPQQNIATWNSRKGNELPP